MLNYVAMNFNDVVADFVPPEGGVATAGKLAANTVMAGCLPEYFPVVIAAVKAMVEPKFNLLGIQATTNPVAPMLIVNGPIRNQLEINGGRGALGPGWRANATIGRAIRLILLNIGGAKPGEVDKATIGQPGKYTFCLGEFEEQSPWEPFHVEQGFSAQDSTATVIGVQGTQSVIAAYSQPESILKMLANAMSAYGNNNYVMFGGNPVLALCPGYANIFHKTGWSKNNIKEWLYEHTKIHISELPDEPHMILRPEYMTMDGDYLCLCKKPEDLVVIVAGGPEPYHAAYFPNFGDTELSIKPIAVK
jgi:hypothetical protein